MACVLRKSAKEIYIYSWRESGSYGYTKKCFQSQKQCTYGVLGVLISPGNGLSGFQEEIDVANLGFPTQYAKEWGSVPGDNNSDTCVPKIWKKICFSVSAFQVWYKTKMQMNIHKFL